METATNTELIRIIATGTEDEKARAWDRLLDQVKQIPYERCLHNCLSFVVATADDHYRQKAWDLLLQYGPADIDFAQIIARSAGAHAVQEKAWEKLVQTAMEDGYCFLYIIDYGQEPYRSMALAEFVARGYPRKDLEALLCGRPGKKTEFWNEKIAHLLKK